MNISNVSVGHVSFHCPSKHPSLETEENHENYNDNSNSVFLIRLQCVYLNIINNVIEIPISAAYITVSASHTFRPTYTPPTELDAYTYNCFCLANGSTIFRIRTPKYERAEKFLQ